MPNNYPPINLEATYFVQPRIWKKEGAGFDYVKLEVHADSKGFIVTLLTDSASDDLHFLGHDSARFFDIVANQPTVTTLAVDVEDLGIIDYWERKIAWKKYCQLLAKSLPNLQSLELKQLHCSNAKDIQDPDGDWPKSMLLESIKKSKLTRFAIVARDVDGDVSLNECFEHVGKFKSLTNLSVTTTRDSLGGMGPDTCRALARLVKGLKKLEALTLPLEEMILKCFPYKECIDEVMKAVRTHTKLKKNGVSKEMQQSLDALRFVKECVEDRNIQGPPKASQKPELAAWVGAMADCLEKDRFDSFHYFFSQLDPMLYLSSGHFKSNRRTEGRPRKRARRSELELLA
jgi:hypothetical protein